MNGLVMYSCGCIGIHLPPEQHVMAPDPKEKHKPDFVMLWQCKSPKHNGCGPSFNLTKMDDSDPVEVRPLREEEIVVMADEIHGIIETGKRMRRIAKEFMVEVVENFAADDDKKE